MHRSIASLLFSCFLFTVAVAQGTSSGYTTVMLLRSFAGARVAGLSGAYTAAVNEPNAIFINAAALSGQAELPVVSTTHSRLGLSRSITLLSVSQNLSQKAGFGAGFAMFNGGEFERTDASGQSLGMAAYTTYVAQAGVGITVASTSIGLAGKYVQTAVSGDGAGGSGFAFDVGARIPFGNSFQCGISAQNIGSITWNNSASTRDALPWSIRAGLSTEISESKEQYVVRSTSLGATDTIAVPSPTYVLLSLEAALVRGSEIPSLTFGSEYSISNLLAIRGGVALVGEELGVAVLAPPRSLAGGVSFRFPAEELPFRMSVDYAVTSGALSTTGLTHYLTLTAAF